MFSSKILSYGCSSAAGPSTRDFWKSLTTGLDHSEQGCAWPGTQSSTLDLLVEHSLFAWRGCLEAFDASLLRRLGVIFASTKGCIDDWVWSPSPDLSRDPLTPVLEAFLKAAELEPLETICVSNACASSLAALLLAQEWLRQDRVDHVLVLAADHAGPFIRQGFATLRVLATERSRPFSRDRDGLSLGDGAAAILLGREGGAARLAAVATDTEGFAVTRPAQSGTSLRRACIALPNCTPDLIVAHGTGTVINDRVEDQVLASLFPETPITGTKWCIGHTLATSAAMDVIAACEVLRQRKVFRLANTQEVDPELKGRYLSARHELAPHFDAKQVLVTSLGFGGVHAAALIQREGT